MKQMYGNVFDLQSLKECNLADIDNGADHTGQSIQRMDQVKCGR